MKIPPVKPENISQAPKTRARHVQSESPRAEAAQDSMQTETSSKLLNALRNEPGVRNEVAERGKLLAADPNYPPAETVSALAKLFVQPPTK